MLVADHDLRNSTDMLIVDRVAKDVFHLPGIARVQTITRPLGTPIDGTSIPYIVGQQGVNQKLGQSYGQARTADLLTQAADISNQIDILRQQLDPAETKRRRSTGTGRSVEADGGGDRRTAGQDRQLRRLLPAHPELLLLGTALLRHPRLLHVAVPLRRAGRHRPTERPARADDGQPRQDQRPATQTACAASSADRQPGNATAIRS